MLKEPKFEKKIRMEKEPQEKPSRFDYYKLMSGLIGRAEELMMKQPDLPAERFANLLIYDKSNEAPPTPRQEEIIQKMAQRFVDARNDVLSYAAELSERFGGKSKLENPLEILEKNTDAKWRFLRDLGLPSPIDTTKFKIHTVHPTAIGVECEDIEDYAWVSEWTIEEAMTTEGFFTYKDFTCGLKEKFDKARVEKLNQNVYFLNGVLLKGRKQKKEVQEHEIQHHLFRRYFDTSPMADFRHEREELLWRIDVEPKESEKLKAKRLASERNELIARELELRKKQNMPRARYLYLEESARDEFSSYLKEGDYRYDKQSIFGKENYLLVEKPLEEFDDIKLLRVKFDILKKELWRLEAGEVNPKNFYKIFEVTSSFDEAKEELSKIDSKISEKGLANLLDDETDINLLFWLKEYIVEKKQFDIKPLILEIENWCVKRLEGILEKNVEDIGSLELALANKYVFETNALTNRASAEINDALGNIAGIYLENTYREVWVMDPILASAIKEANYNPYTGNKIERIDDRIAFAEKVTREAHQVREKFVSLIEQIKSYDFETAAALMGEEIHDPKDGHRLSLREKVEEAEEELDDLKKMNSEFWKIMDEIAEINESEALKLISDIGKGVPLRIRFREARGTLEELKKQG